MNGRFLAVSLLMVAVAVAPVPALRAQQLPKGTKSGFVSVANGVKIHYVEAGSVRTVGNSQIGGALPPGAMTNGQVSISGMHKQPSLLFIPGWTMPTWIWEPQIAHFSKTTHVVAMDPRAQGESTKTAEGLYPEARARDIKAIVDQLKLAPVVLVGWSMGVGEVASYIDQFGNDDLAGIVLVDGSVHIDDEFAGKVLKFAGEMMKDRAAKTEAFVRGMYKKPQSEEYIKRLTAAAMETPTASAMALFVGAFSTDGRPALAKIARPTLLVVTKSPFDAIYFDMQKRIPGARLEQFEDAGHALFVDDAERFNALVDDFLKSLPNPQPPK